VVASQLGEWFEFERPAGGMFLWLEARDPDFSTDAMYPYALEERVAFVPSSIYDATGALTTAMRLNFTRNAPDVMTEGVERMARAIRRYLAERRP
ncbi:MAG: PLP-dependent aminotransferase family protein, partial [Chloroflexota bacterium]